MSKGPVELREAIKRKIKALHNRSAELESKMEKLEGLIKSKDLEITELKEKVSKGESELETLKLAKAYQGADSSDSEAKAKINEMVKEIDRCIALLNN